KPGGGFALPGLRGDNVGPVTEAPPGVFLKCILRKGKKILLRIPSNAGEQTLSNKKKNHPTRIMATSCIPTYA
ncbi:hypothetical protein, partial [Enterobacter intestinihominis]